MRETMKTTNYIFYFLILIVLTILTSCDPGVSYSKIIQNDSDYDIIISVHNGESYYYSIDSLYVVKHSEETIMAYSGLGQTFEFEDCNIYADSLTSQIANNDSLKLILDLNDQSNWNFSILNETFKSGGTCECRIILKNEDVE